MHHCMCRDEEEPQNNPHTTYHFTGKEFVRISVNLCLERVAGREGSGGSHMDHHGKFPSRNLVVGFRFHRNREQLAIARTKE